MNSSAKVGVAIVNYRTPDLVQQCLLSLNNERQWLPDLCVVVVDNDSGDNSLQIIGETIAGENWGDWVCVVNAQRNGGFSYGNNIAFRKLLYEMHCDYIWMLNPDTYVLPQAGKALLDFLQTHSSAGMVGSRLQDEDGTAHVSAFNYPSPIGELLTASRFGFLSKLFMRNVVAPPPQNCAHQAQWLAGASIMLSRALIANIPPMDENYFLYFEEVDYCKAAASAGFQIWYQPESRVVHKVGAATGISDTRKKAPRRPKYWFESRRRYFLKHHGAASTLIADLLWLLGYSSWLIRKRLQRKPDLDPPHFLMDFIRYSVLCRGFNWK